MPASLRCRKLGSAEQVSLTRRLKSKSYVYLERVGLTDGYRFEREDALRVEPARQSQTAPSNKTNSIDARTPSPKRIESS